MLIIYPSPKHLTTALLTAQKKNFKHYLIILYYQSATNNVIIHQTHYEKSDWSRAFNQFSIACELDIINVISAADITFNVCLVTKPLEVFSSETKWLNASLLFLRMNYVKNV